MKKKLEEAVTVFKKRLKNLPNVTVVDSDINFRYSANFQVDAEDFLLVLEAMTGRIIVFRGDENTTTPGNRFVAIYHGTLVYTEIEEEE